MNAQQNSMFPIEDHVGAWVPHGHFLVDGAPSGPLAGLSFAVKDLFDVAGYPTGAGNPAWLASHAIPNHNSPLVEQLLAAGATLVGKTLTDELAYSINGDNVHYGTPINSAAPRRVPGGSSSGSAAAVAARLCDFALGTDTGGSTRVPASYCGVWGLRTSHGLLSRDGLVPLAPGFDTPTWLAHDAATFLKVARALLPATPFSFRRALLLEDALAEADDVFHVPALRVFEALAPGRAAQRTLAASGGVDQLDNWRQAYITVSALEAWQTHGDWIATHEPYFSPAVAARFAAARDIAANTGAQALAQQAQIRAAVRALLGEDGVAVLPSAASVAPRLDASDAEVDAVRARTFRITCVAGLAGLPQVSLPFFSTTGLPVGISLLGPAGSDLALVELATSIWQQLQEDSRQS
ncbi:amidase [Noviherbaspirillum sp. L7-7A]|uniref:amidase n=1 Tax=Noviherbaspirillum sp. L7-7A TaxID=2850560 RepID=UPI001C2CAF24|nr:amidase [Noviherbaspirillum sp. L7-7A]MBV0882122.1 amidase [Noviherbaspirillum sp. L7-7A]